MKLFQRLTNINLTPLFSIASDCARVELPAVCANGFRHHLLLLFLFLHPCDHSFPTFPFNSSSRCYCFSQLCTRKRITSNAIMDHVPGFRCSLTAGTVGRQRLCDGRWRETWKPRVPLKTHCVCVAKLLSNLSLSVYTSKECCQILTDISRSLNTSWENGKPRPILENPNVISFFNDLRRIRNTVVGIVQY